MTSQVVLWSIPRTSCHLLERILSKQSNVTYQLHPFQTTRPPQHDILKDSSNTADVLGAASLTQYEDELATGARQWVEAVNAAHEKGQILFIHEHPFMTISPEKLFDDIDGKPLETFSALPESILLGQDKSQVSPLFTIRHPILQCRSVLEAIVKTAGPASEAELLVTTSWAWSHALYDWYVAQGIRPLILDADDFTTSETFVREVCSQVGLNPDEAIFQWPKTPHEQQEEMHPVLKTIQGVLINSQGLEKSRAARNLDLVEEKAKWERDFGADDLALLNRLYERAMPHWEYLYARRFQELRS